MYDTSMENLFSNILHESSPPAIWDLMKSASDRMGVDLVQIFFGDSINDSQLGTDFFTTYPLWYKEIYNHDGFSHSDNAYKHFLSGNKEPLFFGSEFELKEGDNTQRKLSAIRNSFGHKAAVMFPIYDVNGIETSSPVTYSINGSRDDFLILYERYSHYMALFAQVCHCQILSCFDTYRAASLLEKLNNREIDSMLYWATGLSIDEIATKLRVSSSTVRFHINSARTKIGVSTNIQAAVAVTKAFLQTSNNHPRRP